MSCEERDFDLLSVVYGDPEEKNEDEVDERRMFRLFARQGVKSIVFGLV